MIKKKKRVSYIKDHDILIAARKSDHPCVHEALEKLRAITFLCEGTQLSEKWIKRNKKETEKKRFLKERKMKLISKYRLIVDS